MDCILIISILILLVILITSSREMYKAIENASYPGLLSKNLLKPNMEGEEDTPENVKAECKAFCDDDTKCKGFVLYPNGKCGIIKEKIQEGNLKMGDNVNATTYLKGKTGDFEPVGYNVKEGDQLEVLENTNIKKCKKVCKDNKKCKGLVYDKDSQTCILKKKLRKEESKVMTILKKVAGQSDDDSVDYDDEEADE